MSTRARFAIIHLTVAALAVASVAAAPMQETTQPEAESERLPATETLYIAAGCPEDTPGTCTSTRWLGLTAGDATSNYITAITPVDEALYHVEGGPNWRDYPSDDSLAAEGYPLRADEDIEAVVALSAQGPGAAVTVHARVTAFVDGQFTTFGPQEQFVEALVPTTTTEVPFSFDIPEELDGAVLSSATFDVAVHGANVAAGYIDQQGGSTVDLPYWQETEPAA